MFLLLALHLYCLFPTIQLTPLLDFYPFGPENGDKEIPSTRLESTNERISIIPGVSIRGRAYDRVRVSTKGYLKFRTIEGNDLKYWKLMVVQNGVSEFTEGAVYYRQTSDPDLLNSTASEVIKYFPSQQAFSPTWAMVITWFQIRIHNQEDDDVITSQQLLRTDVRICEDISTTQEPTTAVINTTKDALQPTEAACVNASDATYIQELAVRGQRERSSLATFQAALTTDGTYTYYLLNYDGTVTCRGTGYLSSDAGLSDFSAIRDLVPPGPTNIGEHGKWMYEIGQGCSNKYDLVFALDVSGSVEPKDLETTKGMVLYILQQLNLGQEHVRAGLISFDDKVSIDSQLTPSLSSLKAALSRIQVAGGTSNLPDTISSVKDVFNQRNGGRPEVTQIAVIITDGISIGDPSFEASLARSENIALIVIGIGRGIDYDQLRSVVSKPVRNNLLTLFNYDMLPALQDMLIDRICQVMPNSNSKTKPDLNVPAEGAFSNSKGTMLGGQRIDVYGPCYTANATIRADFGSQTASCTASSSDVASCTVPLVYFTGVTDVNIEVNGESFYSRYTYENPLQSNPGVLRNNPLEWMENGKAVISYDPEAIGGNRVDIKLFGYKESLSDGSIVMKSLYTIASGEPKSRQFSFSQPVLTDVEDFIVGVIQVSGSDDSSTHLWSDIHPILWAMDVTSSEACNAWVTSERHRPPVQQDDMTQCPCTLQQAENELGRFRPEPGCTPGVSVYCMTGGADAECFQSIDMSPDGFHQRCCYDENGSLLDARHMTGGGTSSRYSPYVTGQAKALPKPGIVPVFSNLYWDFVPFYHCCIGSNVTSHCRDFFQLRPPSDCREYGGYKPSTTGAIDSDPIVSTLDGSVYAFSAFGEFSVLETPNKNLVIQGRVIQSTVHPKETVLTSLVITNSISGPDVVQIGLEYQGGQPLVILRVNGHLDYAQQTGTIALKGVTVTRQADSTFIAHLNGRGVAVHISVVDDHLEVVFFVPPTLLGQLTGLLGYYDTVASNDFTARDGSNMAPNSSTVDLHTYFVMSWRLTGSESLFTYPKGKTFYSQAINEYSFIPSYVDANHPVLQAISTQVDTLCAQSLDCRYLLQEKLNRGESLNDTTTGALRLAREALAEVAVCPFLSPSVDLTLGMNVSGYFPGSVAALFCPPGWVVVGYDRLFCKVSGEWNGNATYCEGVLYTDPPAGSMLGGQQIAIRGPHLVFVSGIIPYIRISEVTVPCTYGDRYVAYCRTPMVTKIGVTTVYANVMNGSSIGWVYRGEYVYQNMAVYAPSIRREEPEKWTVKGQHVITWSPEDVDSAYVMIELYGYKEDLSTGAITWRKLTTLQQQHDARSGRYIIDSTNMFIPNDFTVGILKMTPNTGTGSAFWSDVHPLTWASTMDHKALCRRFTSHDRTLPPLAEAGLISCPCSVDRARADDTNFKVDVGCSPDSDTTVNCLYNKGAQICFRSIPMSGWEQRCCYDDRGVLLNARDFTGGGSPGRYHNDGSNPYSAAGSVPHLSHFSGDVMPYLHCCVYSTEFCKDYFTQRRPSDCVLEFPPRPALVEGDPHFITFDEVSYTFDGLGEFVILQAMNGSLQVHGRTESLPEVRGTCFTSFALKHTDTEVVEIRRSEDRQNVNIFYDRRQLSFNLTVAREYAFAGITIEVESSSKLSVSFPRLSFVMDIEVADEMMNAMLSVPRNFTDNTEGLLGIYNSDPTDDFTSRDGYAIRPGLPAQSIHTNFGLSWKVTKTESLFTYDLKTDYEFYNNQPYSPEYKASSDIDSRMVSGFVKTMCGSSKDCMYDYINKGHINVATRPEDRRMRDKFWLRLQDLTTSQSCGFLDTIADELSRDVSGYGIGDTIRLTCSPGYRLVGASVLLCTDEGWDQEEGHCEPVSASTEAPSYRIPNPSFSIQETDSTPSWAIGTVVGVVGGVAAVGGTILAVRGILVAKEVARIQAYKLTNPQFGTSGSARPSFKPDLLQ